MLRIGLGIQADKGTRATTFIGPKITDSSLAYGIEEIVSEAVTGKEIAVDGYTIAGVPGGDITVELTRATLDTILDVSGFVGSVVTNDKVFKIPESAAYKYVTIVQEYTDINNAAYHDIYDGCVINSIRIELVADSYVKCTLSIVSTQKGETASGTFGGTITADTEEALFCEEATASLDGTEQTASADSITLEIGNNLSTTKAVAGNHILQKGGNRTIDVSIDSPELDSADYVAAVTKALSGTGIVVALTLKNKSGEEATIVLPKVKYSSLSPSGINAAASVSRSLSAKWDDGTSTAAEITLVGTEA